MAQTKWFFKAKHIHAQRAQVNRLHIVVLSGLRILSLPIHWSLLYLMGHSSLCNHFINILSKWQLWLRHTVVHHPLAISLLLSWPAQKKNPGSVTVDVDCHRPWLCGMKGVQPSLHNLTADNKHSDASELHGNPWSFRHYAPRMVQRLGCGPHTNREEGRYC